MANQQVKVLLVEDDPFDQMAVQRMVKQMKLPYKVVITATVAEAMPYLVDCLVDVALVDYSLPDGNGLDILNRADMVPCIFITGMDDVNVAVEAMKNGAYDFLIKDTHHDYLLLLPSIIEKTLARKAIDEKIELQQHMISSLGEMVVLLDEDATVVFTNAAVEKTLGYFDQELSGMVWGDRLLADNQFAERLRSDIRHHARNGIDHTKDTDPRQYDLQLLRKDGVSIWTSWTESKYSQNRIILVGHDITNRKRMEDELIRYQSELEERVAQRTNELSKTNDLLRQEILEKTRTAQALQDSEQRFKTLFDKSADAVFIHNLNGDILDANQAACERLGYTREQLLEFSLQQITGKEHVDNLFEHVQELIENERLLYDSSCVSCDGNVHLVEVNSQIIEFNGVLAVLSTSRDVSVRKEAERALIRSEEKYRSLVENLSEVIFILDTEHCYIYISPVIESISGYLPQEMTGQSFLDYVYKDDIPIIEHHIKMVESGSQESHTFRIVARDGTLRHIRCSSRLMMDEGQIMGCTGILSDFTEQKLTQNALIESQKLADIGTLTGGVMHEIKSPLQVITGISDTLGRRLKDNEIEIDRVLQQLENINRNAWRINAIANSLLNYAHFSSGEIEAHYLNDIVSDTLLLIEHQLSTWSNITVQTDLNEFIPLFDCDRNKITQVLINLLTNARDAMPAGGNILIHTGADEKREHVVLQVSDTGEGISEDIRDKIFNTFFTTKPKGTGTGLGLTIIKDIVEAHHGVIDFESHQNSGTTFTLQFPVRNHKV